MNNLPLNKAIQYVGLDIFEEYWKIFNEFESKQIISVGSGNGTLEYYLNQKYGSDIICIDPSPNSYQKNPDSSNTLDPLFPTCDELLQKMPYLISDCKLFLNWSTPNEEGRFDIYAIKDLKPKYIFVVCDTSGAGGSDLFLTWLLHYVPNFADFTFDKNDGNFVNSIDDYKDEEKTIFDKLPKYKILESTYRQIIGKCDTLFTRYVILTQNDNASEYKISQKIKLDKIENDSEGCMIS
jgi:hypothetical protein